MSLGSRGRGGRPSRRRGPRSRLISLKRVERLELLYGLPKLGAQVISPRRESSRRLRILEVVGLHVLGVVTPEGFLARVVRLKSRRDDLPEDHARVDRGTDSAGV